MQPTFAYCSQSSTVLTKSATWSTLHSARSGFLWPDESFRETLSWRLSDAGCGDSALVDLFGCSDTDVSSTLSFFSVKSRGSSLGRFNSLFSSLIREADGSFGTSNEDSLLLGGVRKGLNKGNVKAAGKAF